MRNFNLISKIYQYNLLIGFCFILLNHYQLNDQSSSFYSDCYELDKKERYEELEHLLDSLSTESIKDSNYKLIHQLYTAKLYRIKNNTEKQFQAINESYNQIRESTPDSLKAFILDELALAQYRNKAFDPATALHSIYESLELKKSINNPSSIAKSYTIKGNIFYSLYSKLNTNKSLPESPLDSALHCYDLALNLPISPSEKTLVQHNIARIYSLKGEYQKALKLLKECHQFYIKEKNHRDANIALINYSNLLYKSNRYQEALIILDSILIVSSDQNQLDVKKWTLNNLVNIHTSLFDFEKALHYRNLSYDHLDKINSQKTIEASARFEKKFQTEKIKREMLQQQINYNSQKAMGIGIGSFLLVSLILLHYRWTYEKTKTREAEKALALAYKTKEVEAINAKLDGQESERRKLSLQLHDSVVGKLIAANMHLKIAEQKIDSEVLQKPNTLIANVANEIRDLSHHLYPPTLLQLGLGPALKELSEQYTNEQITFHTNDNIESIKIKDAKATKIYYILQELMNNSLKHSRASNCHIKIDKLKNLLTIHISDDGIGLDTLRHSNGLGLQTVNSRINSLNGSIEILPSSSHHWVMSIEVPL